MAPTDAKERAARSVRFGRLDRATSRLDRERAEAALRALSFERDTVLWAEGLVEGLRRVAGRRVDPLFASVGRRNRDGWRTLRLGRGGELGRLESVAAIDALLLSAARHEAAAAVRAEDRLAYRTGLPHATVASQLAVTALEEWRDDFYDRRVLGFAAELAAAGVMCAWFLAEGGVVLVPRPDATVADGRLHSPARPAARWASEGLWFWQGVWIPERLASRRRELGLADVFAERNVERRRVLVDVIGFEALAREVSGGEPAQQDDYGRLWRLGPLLDDEEYVAVEVVNSTPEPDGSFRRYFLRVPPTTKTARAGVAWSFDVRTRDYKVAAES